MGPTASWPRFPPPATTPRSEWLATIVLIVVAAVLSCNGTNDADLNTTQWVSFEPEPVSSVEELLGQATCVVIGGPVGEPEMTVLEDGSAADYTQRISVSSVVKGDPAKELTVVRLGINPDVSDEIVVEPGHEVAGPIPPGTYVFFLMPGGREDTWSIVGHDQGLVKFVNDHIQEAPFPELDGMDEEQLSAFIDKSGQ